MPVIGELGSLKVAQLRQRCQELGLSTAGVKKMLLARVLEHYEKEQAEAAASTAGTSTAAADDGKYKPHKIVKSILDAAGGTALDRSVPLDRSVLSQGIAQKQRPEGTQRTSRKGTDGANAVFYGAAFKAHDKPQDLTKVKPVKIHRPGITKSGRRWKCPRKDRHSSLIAVPQLRSSWEQKMKKKAEEKARKELQRAIERDIQTTYDRQRLERENKRNRKAANREKSVVVQVIKDPKKIKKMKRKDLKNIRKSDLSASGGHMSQYRPAGRHGDKNHSAPQGQNPI